MSAGGNDVVKLTWLEGGIAVVALEDRTSRNMFSTEFGDGVTGAFAAIAANAAARVVVVHGYDNYFSCGGTPGQLIAILEGRLKYTDFLFFDELRRCPIPVIAALQGHAIGGGLAFGAHADVLILGEECIYAANFMEYGFTPGMGTTFTLPAKFGEVLGWEMLYTGANYRGAELRSRGVQLQVCPKADVIARAMTDARILVAKPRVSLQQLKARWVESTHERFELAVRREVEMHQITFALPDVQQRIRAHFDAQSPAP